MSNPCLSCGACCAYYRVSFYWSEADPFLGGTVPGEMTVPIHHHYLAMRGTEQAPARCLALEGDIGTCVKCAIYAQRPSPCHDVLPSWQDGLQDEKCDKARLAHGLPPLSPDFSPEFTPPSRLPEAC